MLIFTQRRYAFSDLFTHSEVTVAGDVENKHVCYAFEDTDRHLEDGGEKIYGETAIPRGTYKMIISYSPHFKRKTVELLNVPQFDHIRVHAGNKVTETLGCPLVGMLEPVDDFIGDSRSAEAKIFRMVSDALARGEECFWRVM